MIHAEQQGRLEPVLERWRGIMGLADWRLNFAFYDGSYISFDGTASGEAIATCSPQWQYQRASIAFNLEEVERLDDGSLEAVVVHELVHVLVAEMGDPDLVTAHEERSVTMIERALLRAAGWEQTAIVERPS